MNNVFKNVKCKLLLIVLGLMGLYTVKAGQSFNNAAEFNQNLFLQLEQPSSEDKIKKMIESKIEFLTYFSKKPNKVLENIVYAIWDDYYFSSVSFDSFGAKLIALTTIYMAVSNYQYFLEFFNRGLKLPANVIDEILKILESSFNKISSYNQHLEELASSNFSNINSLEIFKFFEELELEAYKINAIFTNKIDDTWKGSLAFPFQLVVWLMENIFGKYIAAALRLSQNFVFLRDKAKSLGREGQESQVTYKDFEKLLAFFRVAIYAREKSTELARYGTVHVRPSPQDMLRDAMSLLEKFYSSPHRFNSRFLNQ